MKKLFSWPFIRESRTSTTVYVQMLDPSFLFLLLASLS